LKDEGKDGKDKDFQKEEGDKDFGKEGDKDDDKDGDKDGDDEKVADLEKQDDKEDVEEKLEIEDEGRRPQGTGRTRVNVRRPSGATTRPKALLVRVPVV
jgi:hypothetical protein